MTLSTRVFLLNVKLLLAIIVQGQSKVKQSEKNKKYQPFSKNKTESFIILTCFNIVKLINVKLTNWHSLMYSVRTDKSLLTTVCHCYRTTSTKLLFYSLSLYLQYHSCAGPLLTDCKVMTTLLTVDVIKPPPSNTEQLCSFWRYHKTIFECCCKCELFVIAQQKLC